MSLDRNSSIPKDITNIDDVLRSQGVINYDPQIISQLLEFSHNYTVNLLNDADDNRELANRMNISRGDIDLAIFTQEESLNSTKLSNFHLQKQAELINSLPLKSVPEKKGVLLPPKKLTADNYDVSSTKKTKKPNNT